MRWSTMHIPTLREDPADAGAPSHRLLLRGGYIRQLMAGHYSLLPLAVRVQSKVIEIIRQEMNAIGAQEALLPDMHPAAIWIRSPRPELIAPDMFQPTPRKRPRLACTSRAKIDRATSRLADLADGPGPDSPARFDSPGVRAIEDLATGYDAPATRQIKTLVSVLDGKLTLVLMRGDHALNEQKLIDATGATTVRPAQPDEIRETLGALPGSLGAVGVGGLPITADL